MNVSVTTDKTNSFLAGLAPKQGPIQSYEQQTRFRFALALRSA